MKQLLRTYALGLLTATIIIGIYFFYVYELEPETETVDLSESELITTLEAAGYYVSKTEHANDDQETNENPITDETDEINSELDSSEGEVDDPEITEPPIEEGNSVILVIEPGMTVSEVANILVEENLVETRDQFVSYLVDNNYGTNIQIGQFELNDSMSLAEIVDTIANQNN